MIRITFYLRNNQIKLVEEWQNELNTLDTFDKKHRDILNPVYNSDLDKLKRKKLPFGLTINIF